MELKKYQQKTLDTISEFLKDLTKEKPEYAFMHIKKLPYKDEYFGTNVPFICIKIPTGGGKTFVGCHATALIMGSFLQEKLNRGIVMWFVPSEAIKSQTLKKFKDRNDLHRKILDEYFDNKVKVLSNEEAKNVRKADYEDGICIIVSSLDAFRREKSIQNKYKVYQENGSFIDYFENVDDDKILEKDESGVIHSLANVIRLNNPLIVIDEGHRTKSDLSIDFLKGMNPSFVIEFTATPRPESNILVEIHSSELKEEEMVKLPLVLQSHAQWQNAVNQGVLRREELERICKKERESIRPIALLQAEQLKESENKITVSAIRDFLINSRKIPDEEIAIKTSEINDLEGVDLFSKKCKIRYIITVNALAEGWDCSFAYVLISVANIGSKIAVEQIVGRIMRMPHAKRREIEDLNMSYIFASARNFNEAANQIIKGLESNGFSRLDLVNSTDSNKKYEFEVDRKFDEDFSVPMFSFENEELAFEDLIGQEFELHKQVTKFDFQLHYDSDGRAIFDVKDGDRWVRGAQQILKLTYKDKNCSQQELVQWLDKRLKFIMIAKEDKTKFLTNLIGGINTHSLQELSINRFVLSEQINALINSILFNYGKGRFEILLRKKEIKLKEIGQFPERITLTEEIPQEFNRNYYAKIDKLNKEELNFITRLDLDSLSNIKFWIRNREKKDPFYLQGWRKGKFYPDFIAVTEKGNILVLEWKGEDRVSNDDTKYKEELAKNWEDLGKGKLHFYLVQNGNIEDVLTKLRVL